MKSKLFLLLFILVSVQLISSLSLSQIEFCTRDLFLQKKTYFVVFPYYNEDAVVKEARRASVISKKKIQVLGITDLQDFYSKAKYIKKKPKQSVAIILTDNNLLNPATTATIINYLNKEKIPVISTRPADTFKGAFISIFENKGSIEVHLNKITGDIIGFKIPDKFLKKSIVDVE